MSASITIDQTLLDTLAAGIRSLEDNECDGDVDTAYEMRVQMVKLGLVLTRFDGWVPLEDADHGYVNGKPTHHQRPHGWVIGVEKVDVTGKTLTLDRKGTIVLRTL